MAPAEPLSRASRKRTLPLRSVVSAAHVAAIWSLVATAVAILLIQPWTGDALFGGDVPDALFIAAVPLLVYSTLLKLVLQAMSRFVELGAVIIVQPIIMLALISVPMVCLGLGFVQARQGGCRRHCPAPTQARPHLPARVRPLLHRPVPGGFCRQVQRRRPGEFGEDATLEIPRYN